MEETNDITRTELDELGEFGLIDQLTQDFPLRQASSLKGVGDDAAVIDHEGNRTLVYTAYNQETDELLSPVEVETGISDGTDVEITSGLAVGDAYYYRYADAISYVTGETEG